jgi:hypothetical protein
LNKILMVTVGFPLIYEPGENIDDAGESHETDDNRSGNCLHSNKHIRVRAIDHHVGAIDRNDGAWNSHSPFGGFLPASGGYDKRTPQLEEHWPGSRQRAQPVRIAFRNSVTKTAQAAAQLTP